MYMIHERQHFQLSNENQEERAIITNPQINESFLTNLQQMFLQNKYYTSALLDYDAEPDFENVHSLTQSDALDIRRL